MEHPSLGIHKDLLIAKELRFCIYKYWLMTKDFQACIYKWGLRELGVMMGPRRFARENERDGAAVAGLEAEDFQEIAPANRARPEVALLFASVSIISCLSSF